MWAVKAGLLASAAIVLLASALLPRVVREMPDFEVYWRAGRRVLAVEPLYRPEDGHYQNKYLPVFAVAAAPLALMPLAAAKIAWFFTTIVSLLALVALSLALLPNRKRPAWALVTLTFLSMLKFYAREVNLGQCNAVMGLLVLIGFRQLTRGRETPGAASIALSVAIKPYTIALLPYLALKRRFGAVAVFAAVLAVMLLLPAVIYGVTGNAALLEAWAETTAQSTAPNLLNQDNVSIWAMYAKWLGPGAIASALAMASIAVLVVVFLAALVRGRSLPRGDYLEWSMLLLMLPLISPQGWDYGLLLGTPAVMLLFNEFLGLPVAMRMFSGTAVAVMSLTIYDVLGRRAYAQFMATSLITVCAIGIVLSLAYLRSRRMA